jgi:hypothetical protein
MALIVALASSAHADSPEDMFGPREVAVGEAMRGGASDVSSIQMNPSGLPLTRELAFEGDFGYRLSDSATLVGAAACDSTSAIPGCFFYNYAGANPVFEDDKIHTSTQEGGISLAYPLSQHVFFGVTTKYIHYDSGTNQVADAGGFNFDAGATVRLTDMVNLGVTGYNLYGEDAPTEFPRAVGGGVLAHLAQSFAISFDSRWNLEGPYKNSARYGGGAELFLRTSSGQLGFPIRAGILHDDGLGATYLSGGLGIAAMRYAIDIAARFSVDGPSSTLFVASVRFFGPRLQGPSTAPTN